MNIIDSHRIKLEGVSAFEAGKSDETCPYISRGVTELSNFRMAWMSGYWAAHVVKHVRNITLSEMLA